MDKDENNNRFSNIDKPEQIDENQFLPEPNEPDTFYYNRIDETEDHPVIGPALRKMMAKKASGYPPFKERADKFGMEADATLVDVFVMSMLASALGGDSESQKIIIDRLDGRILSAVPPAPKRRNNNETKTSLENISDEQLDNMMDKEVNGSDPDAK